MKYVKNILLIVIILACWAGSVSANFVIPTVKDHQSFVLFNPQNSAEKVRYNNTDCTVTPVWESNRESSNGYHYLENLAHLNVMYWGLLAPDNTAGALLVPMNATCGRRYTFNRISTGTDMMASFVDKPFYEMDYRIHFLNARNYKASYLSGNTTVGVSNVTIEYNRNARVVTQEYLWNGSGFLSFNSSETWLKVNSYQIYSLPNRETSDKYFMVDLYHRYRNNYPLETKETLIANKGATGNVQDEMYPETFPLPNDFISYNYYPGTKITITSNLPAPYLPTFSTTAPRTALITGTKWLYSADMQMTADDVNPSEAGALFKPTGWSGGTGRVPATGTSGTVDLIGNASDSTINMQYQKNYRTSVSIDSTLDTWIKADFNAGYKVQSGTGANRADITPIPANGTSYWTPANSSTVVIPERISRIVGGVEELWVLNKSALVLPAWATLSYDDTTNKNYMITQSNQLSPYTYNVTYNKLTVTVSGVDKVKVSGVDADNPKLQGIAGFVPTPEAISLTSSLNDMTLSAPNVFYTDFAGKPNRIKYVLKGWTGTESILSSPANFSSTGATTTMSMAITANSSIIWNYEKQIRVAVTTAGENNPLEYKDLQGATTSGSKYITTIATSWSVTVDEYGKALATPVTKSLKKGMLVVGNGIPEGTTVVNVLATSVELSNTATATYGASAQWFTFHTNKAYLTPASTTENGTEVTGIDTAGLMEGMSVSGPGIQDGTVISSINSLSREITLNFTADQTSTAGLYFGAADARERLSLGSSSPETSAPFSAITFYPYDSSVGGNSPIDRVANLTLTAKYQVFETQLATNGTPQIVMRTLNKALNDTIPTGPLVQGSEGTRKTLSLSGIIKPIDVTWSYKATNVYIIGQPIMPPSSADAGDIDYDLPPTISIGTATVPGDTADSAFVSAWDTTMYSLTRTGSAIKDSMTITGLSSTSGLTSGMLVSGTGIPNQTVITAVDSLTQVTINNAVPADITAGELVFKTQQGERYYPIHPVTTFTLYWPRKNTAATYPEIGTAIWPNDTDIQGHIARAPANLNPRGAVNNYLKVAYSPGQYSASTAGLFQPETPGRYVIQFSTPAIAPYTTRGTKFIVVESTLLRPETLPDHNVDIGSKIPIDTEHNDPEGKTGYVTVADANFDATAYSQLTRTGPIIPVNTNDPLKPLVVVWYKTGVDGKIGWPTKPLRYNAVWPTTAIQLAIGDTVDVTMTERPEATVYVQPLDNLAGFNPNEEHALLSDNKLVAWRNDLNAINGYSDPYVLLKYRDKATNEWAMDVYKVNFPRRAFLSQAINAGKPIESFLPGFEPAENSVKVVNDWHYKDKSNGHWAKAANGLSGTAQSSFVMQWYYYLQKDFYWPFGNKKEGDVVPFMHAGTAAKYTEGDLPLDVTYKTQWPADAPVLHLGETLTTAHDGLPDLYNFMSAEVVFDEHIYKYRSNDATTGNGGPLAKLYAPVRDLYYPFPPSSYTSLTDIIAGLKPETGKEGVSIFPQLPFAIQARLFYDPVNKRLGFKGAWIANNAEPPWLLPNIMTATERDTIKGLSSHAIWTAAVEALYTMGRDPNGVGESSMSAWRVDSPVINNAQRVSWGIPLGLRKNGDGSLGLARSIPGEKNALTAGMAQGQGHVVIVENDHPDVTGSPKLHVIKVDNTPGVGEIKVLKSKNVFDEKLTLHYTGDFGGEPENFTFQWSYKAALGGTVPRLPNQESGWADKTIGAGLTDITIQGADKLTMSDNWLAARYYYKNAWPTFAKVSNPVGSIAKDDVNNWSGWSGPMLAEGWVKRVIGGLNLVDPRVTDFRNNATDTTVSMLSQLGTRYDGQIAFSSDPNYLNSLGLISAYESVLNRAREFSIDTVPPQDYGPTNDALLNITSRLATFSQALANEAYADSVDPTIGFSTKSAEYGSMAPSVFAFQNQVDSLLEEELALLRGRDDSTRVGPFYNRLIWNFTQSEGEVAYAQNYNITDQPVPGETKTDGTPLNGKPNGVINAGDARVMYPQGHGDAWGHYLQSINYYYKLLGHSAFSWVPRAESVTIAGTATMVDYLDERKFAAIASTRAKVGAEILDLTYRQRYTAAPEGQWQGYKDVSTDRAWGVDEWARRTGQAALFDWATANAILPDVSPSGDIPKVQYDNNGVATTIYLTQDLQKIDRSKVPELKTIASQFQRIQAKMTEVDSGLNPLGLANGVVPFDIDPAMVDMVGYGVDSKTHFEQIYSRAEKAMENATAAFDYANGYTQRLRQNQDTLADFNKNLTDQERDYRNRLIEIFGYPYPNDIGPGQRYPDGYDGPDVFNYNYVNYTELTGKPMGTTKTFTTTVSYSNAQLYSLGNLPVTTASSAVTPHPVTYNIDTDLQMLAKPVTWTSKRRAPGRIQQALSDLFVAQAAFNKSNMELDNIIAGIEAAKDNLQKTYNVLEGQIQLRTGNENDQKRLDDYIFGFHTASLGLKRASSYVSLMTAATITAMPTSLIAGVAAGGDVCFLARGAAAVLGGVLQTAFDIGGDVMDSLEFANGQAKERMQAGMELKLAVSDAREVVRQLVQDLQLKIRDIDPQLVETYSLKESLQQAAGSYQATLAEGLRLMDEREEKRTQSAAEVQEYRYQDLGFRVFRNDAIQKYRAQFDLASRYVYLAATSYDYETNLLDTATGAGSKFLSEIARQRNLGVVSNGIPQAGFPGLADVMARLSQNFNVYKTQLGFNNPQVETTPFSLRSELFRIKKDTNFPEADLTGRADAKLLWQNVLKDNYQPDLWKIPEFKRYCRPFAPESAGAQPGIVIKFPTTVTYGKNFFGKQLSSGDSAYSTSNFATKVRSVGLWFENYANAGLSSTPRVYLVPTGLDVLRSPTGDGFATREWLVRDQKIPVPFPIGDSDLNNPNFIPVNGSLSDEFGGIRRVSDFRAYPYSGEFAGDETTSDSRLVGRSVWNTQWMLIIPGSTLLFNKDVGLNSFINSVDDIKLFFKTYSYSGN